MRPPRWPPIEMPGIRNVMPRLSRITGPMPDCIGLIAARALHHERGRHQAEHRAGGADRGRVGVRQQQRAERAGQQRRRSRARGSAAAQHRLEHRARASTATYMLKHEVQRVAGACRKPPVTSRHHSPAATPTVWCRRASANAAASRLRVLVDRLPRAAGDALPSHMQHVDRDQHVGRRRRRPYIVRTFVTCVRCLEQSGQRMPTGRRRSCSRGRSGCRSSSRRRPSHGPCGGSRRPSARGR